MGLVPRCKPPICFYSLCQAFANDSQIALLIYLRIRNFNDGFGGGDEITENLLLNTCRESSDHGNKFWSSFRYAI